MQDRVVFEQPTTLVTRQSMAQQCSSALSLSMDCVVDDMNNTVEDLYAAWPERLFVIDADGRIAYAGKQGPWGFKPEGVETWLTENLFRSD